LKPHHSDIYNSDHNGYSTHPFILGKAFDKTWFGVFINNAAAQDWYIKNNKTSGDVDVKVLSTGGIGDMYFFTGSNPNNVTKAYHKKLEIHLLLHNGHSDGIKVNGDTKIPRPSRR